MTLSKVIPLIFLSIGIFMLVQVIAPFLAFKVWEVGQNLNNGLLISPNSRGGGNVLGISVQSKDNFPVFISELRRPTKASYQQFNLTIPRLKIENVLVYVDSNDLSVGLVHLPGSALPGEKGNVFISGHSAISKFVKDAKLAGLTQLEKGDEIRIEAGATKFRYTVEGFKVVDPRDLSVINPPDTQGRYVSLMTCVPPGLNFKRLIVLGKMI